jgi:hypothetical protein
LISIDEIACMIRNDIECMPKWNRLGEFNYK